MDKPNSILMKIVLGLFLVLVSFSAFPQTYFKGTVADYYTGEPIPYATIFLANTTLGTSSD